MIIRLRFVLMLALATVVGSAAAQDEKADPSPAMLQAGADVVRRTLPAASAPAELAALVYGAMAATAWRPIDTAPQDGRDMLLGLQRDGEFLRGIGRWQVYDEPDKPGFWSVTDWFGAPPAFWMPLPAPPPK